MAEISFGTGTNYPTLAGIERGDDLLVQPGLGLCRVLRVSSTGATVRPRLPEWLEPVARWIEDHLLFPLEDFLMVLAEWEDR